MNKLDDWKILIYILLGVLCMTELILWEVDMVPPYPERADGLYAVVGIYCLSAPAYTVIYVVLAFWAIAAHLQETSTSHTNFLEAIFSIGGFITFCISAFLMAISGFEEDDLTFYYVAIALNIFIASAQLLLGVLLLIKIQCLGLVIFWSIAGSVHSEGLEILLFASAGPAHVVILWGMVISNILGASPPNLQQTIYSLFGVIAFTSEGILLAIQAGGNYDKNTVLLVLIHFMTAAVFVAIISCLHSEKRLKKASLHPYVVYMSPGGVLLQKSS